MKAVRKESILHILNYGYGFMRIAYRSEARNWPICAGRICFFAILMLVFSRLWQALYASGLNAALSPLDMLWYLAATEWMVLSVPAIHLSVEEDLRKGHYAALLTKPVTYIFARLAVPDDRCRNCPLGTGTPPVVSMPRWSTSVRAEVYTRHLLQIPR